MSQNTGTNEDWWVCHYPGFYHVRVAALVNNGCREKLLWDISSPDRCNLVFVVSDFGPSSNEFFVLVGKFFRLCIRWECNDSLDYIVMERLTGKGFNPHRLKEMHKAILDYQKFLGSL